MSAIWPPEGRLGDRQSPFVLDLLTRCLTVVSLVGGHDERRSRRIQDFFDDLAIVDLAASDAEVQWSPYNLGRSAVIIQKMVRPSIRLSCELCCRSGASSPKMSFPDSLGGALSIRS